MKTPSCFLWPRFFWAVLFLLLPLASRPLYAETSSLVLVYEVTWKEKQNTCHPERLSDPQISRWIVSKTESGLSIFDPMAWPLNPFEHSNLPLEGSARSISETGLLGEFLSEDTLEFEYSKNGTLRSRLQAALHFKDDKVTGKFTNHVHYKPGALGLQPLDLFLESNEAYRKINLSVASLPLISAKTFPCEVTGSLEGKRIKASEEELHFDLARETEFVTTLRKGESLFSKAQYLDSEREYVRLTEIFPNRPTGYWHLSRNLYARGEHLPRENRQERLKLMEQARAYGKQGIDRDPKSAESWFFHAVAMGRWATTKGILNAVSVTHDMEQAFLKALSLQSRYNFAGFCTAGDIHAGLSIFYRLVPDWWIVKAITGTRGDIDKSVSHARKAVAVQPYRIEYNKELGVALLCRSQRQKRSRDAEEARKVLEKTRTFPNLVGSDAIDKDHIQWLLDDPEIACGYSRDYVQKISEEDLKKAPLPSPSQTETP